MRKQECCLEKASYIINKCVQEEMQDERKSLPSSAQVSLWEEQAINILLEQKWSPRLTHISVEKHEFVFNTWDCIFKNKMHLEENTFFLNDEDEID